MATQKKEAKLQIVPQLLEEHGAAALPYHSAREPFKRSVGRNTAWMVLQDAGVRGLTLKAWVEKLEAKGIPNALRYCVFVRNAKRRVVVEKKDDKFVAVAPKKPRAKRKKS